MKFGPLTTHFASSGKVALDTSNPAEIEGKLRELLEDARRTHPHIALSLEVFLPYLAARCTGQVTPKSLSQMHGPDVYLACACSMGSAEALATFHSEYLDRLGDVLRTMNLSPASLDEVRQLLAVRLLVRSVAKEPSITTYAGRSSLERWVRAAGVRMVLNTRRTPISLEKMAADATVAVHHLRDPEFDLARAQSAELVREALNETINQLSLDARNVLRMHFLDGLSLTDIGKLHRVHPSTVLRWVTKARELVLDRVKEKLRDRGVGTDSEVESLLRAAASSWDVSVRKFFGEMTA